MTNQEKKLNYEEFIKMAILRLRNVSKSRGIHSVFSGFNEAFREYFGEDPVKITQELASKGKIEIRFAKRGVMIYLPNEAPKSRSELGKEALSKILNTPSVQDKGLVEEVLSKVAPNGIKMFPEGFLVELLADNEMFEIEVSGTLLQFDSNSQNIVISPRQHYRYEAKNPPEAKYIIYTHKVGQKKIKIPKDNRAVFKAVTSYEKYCQEIREQAFSLFLEKTHDEDMAQLLTKEVEQKLDLRSKGK
jgi:hypothetical protein